MEKIEKDKKEILDEKLMFVWDNIPVLSYFKIVRKINKVKIEMCEYDLYQMLTNDKELEQTEYYKSYLNVLKKVISIDNKILSQCNNATFDERKQMIRKDFPGISSTVNHMASLALDKANELLYYETDKGVSLLSKNGHIFNEDTITVIENIINSTDKVNQFCLNLYLLNLIPYINKPENKKRAQTLVKKLDCNNV